MDKEIKEIAAGLKSFLQTAEEDDLILEAALTQNKAAFGSAAQKNETKENFQTQKKQAEEKKQTTTETPPIVAYTKHSEDKAKEIAYIAEMINTCQKCELGKTRIKAVPGEGNVNAKIMFVGEGPGYEEDRQGRPFVGRAGQLLDKIIAAMGFSREEVFIANIVKCHPMTDPSNPDKRSNDRAPYPDEIAVCRRYLEQQIKTISPDYVVALGGVAAKTLISQTQTFGAVRGKIFDLNLTCVELEKPIKILATFHPAALLRNPGWKKEAWENLKVLLADMGKMPKAK